jgi:glycosyltransferase involved in cell wall biosynthesis
MRVGLDGIPLATPRTGVGHYTFELAHHLAIVSPENEFELLSPFPFDPPIQNGDLPDGLRAVQVKVNSLSRRWFAVGLPLHLRQSKFDLFHGTNYEVPLWSKSPSVLTIHDLSLFLYPETHEPDLVRRGRRRLPIMARAAECIITPSETIKREVIQHLRISESKVVVIPDAPRRLFRPMPLAETTATRTKLGIEPEFILFTGTLEPRKNLSTLLKAFQEIMRETMLRPQLVIAGKEGWLMDELRQQVDQPGLRDRLRFTGYLLDDELCALYSSCRVFVYPSLYEGFGLPPLEAMACGAPVITSSISSLIETTGTKAARHVEPLDAAGLAQSIVGLLENDSERKYLSSAGIKHAAGFSWHKVAASTSEVYGRVMKQKSVSANHS